MKKSFQITQQHIDSFNKSQTSQKHKALQKSELFYSVSLNAKHRNTTSYQLPIQDKKMATKSSHKKNNKTTLSEIFKGSQLTKTRKSFFGQKLKSITATSKDLKELRNPFLRNSSNPIFFKAEEEKKEKIKDQVQVVEVQSNRESSPKKQQTPFFLYNNVQEKRQKGRMQLYDNVKMLSGIAKEEEDQRIRNIEIIQLFMKNNQETSSRRSPTPTSLNGSNSPKCKSPSTKQKVYSKFRESVQAIKRIQTHNFNNQIDQELVQILVSKWKNLNKKQIKAMKKKEMASRKALRHLQIKNERRRVIALSLLEWLQKMNRCKVSNSTIMYYNAD